LKFEKPGRAVELGTDGSGSNDRFARVRININYARAIGDVADEASILLA
jgi:hypothetical protein